MDNQLTLGFCKNKTTVMVFLDSILLLYGNVITTETYYGSKMKQNCNQKVCFYVKKIKTKSNAKASTSQIKVKEKMAYVDYKF